VSAEKETSGAVGRKKRFETPVETRNGWEIFNDRSTWDLVAVRPAGNRVYGDAVHFDTWQEAREYADATSPSQERANPSPPHAENLQGAEAPSINESIYWSKEDTYDAPPTPTPETNSNE